MSERRHAHRIPVNFPARYHSKAIYVDGWVANLSRDGLFLRSEFVDTTGSSVAVDLTLPGADGPVAVIGEVVRAERTPTSAGMGIRFTEVPRNVRRSLANFMIERSYRALQRS